ncbi:MAG: bifunctional 3-deoxy-7-phosphoheptulonate synthase/chorismate mutase type II [Flavobacteriales bacterium]|nr:bifunctional 3-deoxy-7-phosphoheptulonate synthase/chorismate mutase type II [Flavobacteriales bacterium]
MSKTLEWWNDVVDHKPFLIAGPCGAESAEQVLEVAEKLADSGRVHLYRAGLWKPRTRPGSFEGEGKKGGQWMLDARAKTGLKLITEVARFEHVEYCLENNFDALWVGARTVVNPFSVQEIADAVRGVDIPIFVKNPMHADVKLWIGAIERFQKAGINYLGAIHRGFSSWDRSKYRYPPMWEVAMEFRSEMPEIPLICDPSHMGGKRSFIQSLAQKSLDLNYDGLMIESHPNPRSAKSDAAQQVTPERLLEILSELKIRNENFSNPEMLSRLEEYRSVVDEIDAEIVKRIAQRMKMVEEIGQDKKEYGVAIYQEKRWSEIQETRTQLANELGLDVEIVREIWNVIHKFSLDKQTKIFNRKEEEA